MADVEARILTVTDELGLTSLLGSIPGISALGGALILAETGDLSRFTSARALVKHAGLRPRANESGRSAGTTTISGKGRPGLRLAAWRAVFSALRHNPGQAVATASSSAVATASSSSAVPAALAAFSEAVSTFTTAAAMRLCPSSPGWIPSSRCSAVMTPRGP